MKNLLKAIFLYIAIALVILVPSILSVYLLDKYPAFMISLVFVSGVVVVPLYALKRWFDSEDKMDQRNERHK